MVFILVLTAYLYCYPWVHDPCVYETIISLFYLICSTSSYLFVLFHHGTGDQICSELSHSWHNFCTEVYNRIANSFNHSPPDFRICLSCPFLIAFPDLKGPYYIWIIKFVRNEIVQDELTTHCLECFSHVDSEISFTSALVIYLTCA